MTTRGFGQVSPIPNLFHLFKIFHIPILLRKLNRDEWVIGTRNSHISLIKPFFFLEI